MPRTPCLLALIMVVPSLVSAQTAPAGVLRSMADFNLPPWFYADSNLVNGVSWYPGTIRKNIVIVVFTPKASRAARDSAIASIHGTVVATDSVFWIVRVASHPDACAVKQAVDALVGLPVVGAASPDLVMSWVDSTGGMPDTPAQKGSTAPCPAGKGLLR